MGQREEQKKDSWERFLNTGKVEDYLRYAGVFHETTEGVKEKPYAGFYSSDRDHSQADSYR